MARSPYDRSGQLRPLKQRSPVAYWTAVVVVGAMVLTFFAALVSAL